MAPSAEDPSTRRVGRGLTSDACWIGSMLAGREGFGRFAMSFKKTLQDGTPDQPATPARSPAVASPTQAVPSSGGLQPQRPKVVGPSAPVVVANPPPGT